MSFFLGFSFLIFYSAALAQRAAYSWHADCYTGQLRANLAMAVLAAASVFALRNSSDAFHTKAALRAKPAFLAGAGICTKPEVVDLVLLDAGGCIVNASELDGDDVMAFQASRPTLRMDILL